MKVEQVAGASGSEHDEEEEDEEAVETFGTETETHHCLQCPHPQEGEVF